MEKIQPQSLLVRHPEVIRIKLSLLPVGSVASTVGLCTSASNTPVCLYFIFFKIRNDLKIAKSLAFQRHLKIPF